MRIYLIPEQKGSTIGRQLEFTGMYRFHVEYCEPQNKFTSIIGIVVCHLGKSNGYWEDVEIRIFAGPEK